jgi:HTH-type transcriptional regulator, transcriptional repressor of NAD biosynthesis genes
MPDVYVPMTALPPTLGHLDLLNFARSLTGGIGQVRAILGTQDGEPYIKERLEALQQAEPWVSWWPLHNAAEDPNSPGFREHWWGILKGMGFREGDIVATSEEYGRWLAEGVGGQWFPYDIARDIRPVRATSIRSWPYAAFWSQILPEFRRHLQLRVTIFGAESTGKTTLARNLAGGSHGGLAVPDYPLGTQRAVFVPEYARPYLETVRNAVDLDSMHAIWYGQRALQDQPYSEYPIVIQDTDLFTTYDYWAYFNISKRLGFPPKELGRDAVERASDLYLLTPSNIPFQADPLRYGGDKREIPDIVWQNALSMHIGNRGDRWHVLDSAPEQRVEQAARLIEKALEKKAATLNYTRRHQ